MKSALLSVPKSVFSLILLFCTPLLSAQSPAGDCDGAIFPCDKTTLTFHEIPDGGFNSTEFSDIEAVDSKLDAETNSLWLK